MSQLKDFALITQTQAWVSPDRAAAALHELTSPAAKKAFAKQLMLEARWLFEISDDEVDRLAVLFADPSSRRAAEYELHRLPFVNKSTEWAGTGYSLIMDAVYGEDEPLSQCHILAIPAQWSSDVWHSERDLGEDGYEYHHWVYAKLPSVDLYDYDEPVKLVLVSENLTGTLCWGATNVSLYRGEVNISASDLGSAITSALTAGTTV